jgi:hypothetical protein
MSPFMSTPVSARQVRRVSALAFAGGLVLSACSASSSASLSSDTGDFRGTGALPAVVDELGWADGVNGVEVELGAVSGGTLERLLVDAGVSRAVPDVLRSVIALDGQITAAGLRFASELLEVSDETVEVEVKMAGFARPQQDTGNGPLDLAVMGIGLLTSIIEQSLDRATAGPTPSNDTPDQPSENHITVNDGDIDVRFADSKTTAVGESTVTVGTEVAGVLGACPSPSGDVAADLSVTMTMEGTGIGSSVGAAYSMDVAVLGRVDDEAHLIGHDMTVSGSASGHARADDTASGGAADIAGYFVEGGSTTSFTGTAAGLDLAVASITGPGVTRTSSAVTGSNAQAFIDSQQQLAMMVSSLVLHRAESFWRSGACIDVDLQTSADPMQLEPLQTIDLAIDAASSEDGAAIAGSVIAVLASGTGSVAPGMSPSLPATIAFTAPGDGSPSRVDIEVRSRRGLGRAGLDLAGQPSFAVDGALDMFRATGTKCGGPGGPWRLDLSADFNGASFTGTMSFELDPATLAGRFVLTGSSVFNGIIIAQQGDGDVAFESSEGAAQLVFRGVAWAGGPAATHSLPVNVTSAPCS